MKTDLLEVQNLTKRFPGVVALRDVGMRIEAGEVLAVIGENGAGKSTLMKILAGVQTADSGQVMLSGKPVRFENTRSAIDAGVILIHQELNLCDNLDVGENIFLGREPHRAGMINRREIYQRSKVFLERVGLEIVPQTIVGKLAIGHQQMVEIAKALSVNARVLIMDEPTSSLSAKESESLFQLIETLRDQGVAIIYISHRLAEVKRLATRVTVLRDGENAGELVGDEITHNNMVRMMVGRDVSQLYSRTPNKIGECALELKNIVTGTWPDHPVSLKVHRGEIVGIAGLVGAGRTELLQTIFGVTPALSGEIQIEGRPVNIKSPADAVGHKLALVPEDRKNQGLIIDFTIRNNIGLAGLKRNCRFGAFVNNSAQRIASRAKRDELRIKSSSDQQVSRFLSGGNQQKVVIGKWLTMEPRVLLLDEPTRGIDIGAKQEIYQLIEKLAESGIAILMASSEMEEIMGVSDRVVVMHEGHVTGELGRGELSEQAIMNLATTSNSHSETG